jgi:signal peptidase I
MRARRPPFGVARVEGRSMEPTLYAGDHLLVRWGARPRLGQLVVVRLPGRPVAVKRAVHREPDGWWVERDNPREGVDSWSVGAVPDADVLGVVVRRYWPLARSSSPRMARWRARYAATLARLAQRSEQ